MKDQHKTGNSIHSADFSIQGRKKARRRNILKGFAVGGAAITAETVIPKSWSAPIVNAVLLPVHAQTTTGMINAGVYFRDDISISVTSLDTNAKDNNLIVDNKTNKTYLTNVINALISPALAVIDGGYNICIEASNGPNSIIRISADFDMENVIAELETKAVGDALLGGVMQFLTGPSTNLDSIECSDFKQVGENLEGTVTFKKGTDTSVKDIFVKPSVSLISCV